MDHSFTEIHKSLPRFLLLYHYYDSVFEAKKPSPLEEKKGVNQLECENYWAAIHNRKIGRKFKNRVAVQGQAAFASHLLKSFAPLVKFCSCTRKGDQQIVSNSRTSKLSNPWSINAINVVNENIPVFRLIDNLMLYGYGIFSQFLSFLRTRSIKKSEKYS